MLPLEDEVLSLAEPLTAPELLSLVLEPMPALLFAVLLDCAPEIEPELASAPEPLVLVVFCAISGDALQRSSEKIKVLFMKPPFLGVI